MVNGCEECTPLWREYAEATGIHWMLDESSKQPVVPMIIKLFKSLSPLYTHLVSVGRRRGADRFHERERHNGT